MTILHTLVNMQPNTSMKVKHYEVWKYINQATNNERFTIRYRTNFYDGLCLEAAVRWLERI